MGVSDLQGLRVYLDANVFIYAMEAVDPWRGVSQTLLRMLQAGEIGAVTSELSLAECLVHPIRLGKTEIARLYEADLQSGSTFLVAPVTREILREAATLRARSSLKLPDAIHVATARIERCDVLVSNDSGIPRLEEPRIMSFSELMR